MFSSATSPLSELLHEIQRLSNSYTLTAFHGLHRFQPLLSTGFKLSGFVLAELEAVVGPRLAVIVLSLEFDPVESDSVKRDSPRSGLRLQYSGLLDQLTVVAAVVQPKMSVLAWRVSELMRGFVVVPQGKSWKIARAKARETVQEMGQVKMRVRLSETTRGMAQAKAGERVPQKAMQKAMEEAEL
jgi:hypothetical protein